MKVSVFVRICCAMQMCGVIAQKNVAMKINAEDVKVMRQTSTVLSCFGPEPDPTHYIEHKTVWTYRPFQASRPEVTLTAGIHADTPYREMFGTGKKYEIKFMPHEGGTNYLFNLHINNIEDTDEGIYTCYTSFKGKKIAGSEDSVQLRVLNEPEFSCNNASAVLGDRYVIMICNLTSVDANSHLSCDNVTWTVGSETRLDIHVNEWKRTDNYDIMEAKCQKIAGGIETELALYQVKQIHFEADYYVVYDSGFGAHRHRMELTELE